MLNIWSFYKQSFGGLSRPVWMLSFVMLINRSGMMVIPFLTIYATQVLHFPVVQAGMLTGAFGLGSVCGSWLGGWFSDKVGTYKVMAFSLLTGGAGLVSLALFKEFYSLLFAIFLVSTIADMLRPAMFSSVAIYSKPVNRTRAISLLRMAINLGISIGPAVGGFIAGTIGYTWLFIVDGITCIIAGLVLLSFLDQKDRGDAIEKDQQTQPVSVYSDWVFILFLLINLFNLTAFFQILSTVPLYFERVLGMTEIQIGLFFTLNGLIIFLFEMPIVYTMERRWKPVFWVITGALMIGFGFYVLLIPAHWLILFLGFSLLIGFGEIFNFPFANSIALNRGEKGSMGQYMGLYTMMFSVSFILAPLFGTQILDRFGFDTLWLTIGSLNVLSVIGFFWIRSKIGEY
ncbi:MAG TPA: MFS transporter [Saprospiraceae bacterium]|nr:MFS transporter [Saprospiraceae bacterium]